MKKTAKAAAILAAMVLAAGLTACQKKDGAEASGAAQKSAGTAKAAKPTPVNEFSRELTEDGNGVKILKYNGSAKNVVIPSEIEGLPVKIIDRAAFRYNETMKSVTIPDSVEEIGYAAFMNCSSLERVTLGNSVQVIDTYYGDNSLGAFENCTALKSITIPDSVKEIGGSAFKGCTALKSVTLGNSVQVIKSGSKNDGAFQECTALESIIIPDSVEEIGWATFKDCTALKSVTLGNSVQKIGTSAFNGCTALQSLTIPDSLQKIEFPKNWNVFYGTELPLATQARLKALGYTEGF